MSKLLPLICLALLHTLVDTCALLVAPVWPELESTFNLGIVALSVVFIVQSLPTSVSQGFFGYLRDRRSVPWLLLIGPLTAAICLTMIGTAPNRIVLCVLLTVGGIGVGAFHPEAAVAAGQMFPEHRARSLSVFMLGGSCGLALGPILSGAVVSQFGLTGLLYVLPPIILLIPVLCWGVLRADIFRNPPAKRHDAKFAEMFEGRVVWAIALFLICSFRLVPNMAMDKVVSFVMDQHGYDSLFTGFAQSLFLASASVGMFWMALKFRPGWERGFMVACPIAGIPLLIVLGWQGCPFWLFVTLLVPTGLALWGTTPAMVSYAQQLFPKGAGVASAITMGLAWGLGGLIQAPITLFFRNSGIPQQALWGFVPCLAVAAIGATFLPKVTESKEAETPSATQAISSEVQPDPIDA